MDTQTNSTSRATASGAADAPVLGIQGAGVKLATGRNQSKLISPKNNLYLAAWNVRTGHHVGQKELIAKELSSCNISIAALSELRLTGSGTMTVQLPTSTDSMTLFYSGGDKRAAGVGFMVDKRAATSVLAFQPVSSRLAVLSINGMIKTHLLSIYAPTEPSSDASKDEFYDELQHTLNSIPKTDLIILAGDFNAHVGDDRSGWESTMGKFGHGQMNDNGLRLLSFAASNDLLVGNTHFQHPKKHQLTWRNPKGNDSAVLDYFLINTRFRSSLKDVRVMRGPDCGSDHYLVRANLQLRLQRAKTRTPFPVKPNWSLLREPATKTKFQIALANRFAVLDQLDDVDREEMQVADAIWHCALPLCPPIRRRTQPWISDECLDLVRERKRVKHLNFERYRQLNQQVRKQLKTEREAHWDKVAADLEEAASKFEFRTLYQTLRRLSGRTKSTNDNIKKADGTFVRSSSERLDRWKEHFEDLLNHDAPQGPPAQPMPTNPPETALSDEEPTAQEVRAAIKSLKNGKAPGADNVTAESIKAGGEVLFKRLHSLIQLIWRTEEIPTMWKKAIIVPILKKGDNRECKNYRGISLLSIIGKVFMKIIQSRLQKHREQTSREEQAGFRPNRSCCDQIFSLRQLMEERIRCGIRTVIVFIDFKSAFDCVHWPALWRTLEAEHVPEKVIRLLQAQYDGSISCVRIRNEQSDEFCVRSGVRQGDVISPLLFNTVIDAIMRKVFEARAGVVFDATRFITDLMFADDSAFFADSDTEATEILGDIADAAAPYGLKINADKTKVLTTDGSQTIVFLNGTQIEQVHEFKYLGSIVQEKKVASVSEVHSRIGQAAAAFASLRWCLWKKSNISLITKIRLFRTLILPILLYGSETWTLLTPDINKLEVFQMRCLRQILGVSLRDKLRNETIRMRCDSQPAIAETIQSRRLRWFGHVCRMDTDRLPHQLLWRQRPIAWKVQKSAPKKTWTKQIEDDLKNRRLSLAEAKDTALDREAWKSTMNDVRLPAAPTATYNLRRTPGRAVS